MFEALRELRRVVKDYQKALPGMLADADAAGTLAPLVVVGAPDAAGRAAMHGRITGLAAAHEVGPDPQGKLTAALDDAVGRCRAQGIGSFTAFCRLDSRHREACRLLKAGGFRKYHYVDDSWSVEYARTIDVATWPDPR